MSGETAVLNGRIDRLSPVPFHFQLSRLLELEIVSGRWQAGVRLPSEHALSEYFAVSRTTVRQSLGRLERESLVVKRKGLGTFVREARVSSWLVQESGGFFLDELVRTGHHVTSRLLRVECAMLPSWAAHVLGLPIGSEGAVVERVRAVEGLVALYVVNHLPVDLASTVLSLNDPSASLYQRLESEHGITVGGARRVLEAVSADATLAALLEVECGAPLAFVESVSWDLARRPFDCYRAWVRTDRLKIDVQARTHRPHHPKSDLIANQ